MPTSQCSEMFPITSKCMGSLVLNVLGTEMHLEVHFQKDALVFLSLVQLMNGSERRHTHVANTKE